MLVPHIYGTRLSCRHARVQTSNSAGSSALYISFKAVVLLREIIPCLELQAGCAFLQNLAKFRSRKIPNSKTLWIDVDWTSIRRESDGSMFNRCLCYLGWGDTGFIGHACSHTDAEGPIKFQRRCTIHYVNLLDSLDTTRFHDQDLAIYHLVKRGAEFPMRIPVDYAKTH